MEANEPKPIERLASLEEFTPDDVDVQIAYPDRVKIIPMRTLSYMQVMAINASVPDPKPPISGVDGNKRPIFDFNDTGYRAALLEAGNERQFKQIVAALRIDIPGETEAEKVAYLKGLSNARILELNAALNKLMEQGEAQLLARAETFHANGNSGAKHLSANGMVTQAVEAAFGS